MTIILGCAVPKIRPSSDGVSKGLTGTSVTPTPKKMSLYLSNQKIITSKENTPLSTT